MYGTVLNLTTAFNSRQDITSLKYANSQAQPLWSKAYSWDRNGANLLSVTDQISGNVRSFSYDYMNRLASTMDASGGVSDTYTMDAWGNRQESGTFSFIQPFGPGNQISATGYVYDSSGNLTADGLGNTYSYDADGKMSASNGAAYTRDSFGQRVRKDDSGAATEYFYFGGQLLATRDPSSSQWTDYIYAGSRLIAEIPVTSTDTAFYRIGDHLDSLVQKTDSAGNVLGANDVSPYGELFSSTASDPLLFTQHERDAENSSDSALYRQYASTQGRWLSPDPYNGSYNLADPQSLNRYTYLSGRPQGSVDPDGLYQLAGEGGGDEGVGGLIGSIFYYFFSNLFSGGGGAPAGNPHSTVNTTFGTPHSNTNGTFVFPVNVGLSYADAGTGTGAGFGVAAPVFVFSVSAFDFSLGAPSVSAAVAPSNGQSDYKTCISQYYSSAYGKAVELGSPLSMIPGWDPEPGKNIFENVVLMGGKFLGLKPLSNVGNASLTSIGTSSTIATPVEGLIGKAATGALNVAAKAGPIVWGAAAGIDTITHASCATPTSVPIFTGPM